MKPFSRKIPTCSCAVHYVTDARMPAVTLYVYGPGLQRVAENPNCTPKSAYKHFISGSHYVIMTHYVNIENY